MCFIHNNCKEKLENLMYEVMMTSLLDTLNKAKHTTCTTRELRWLKKAVTWLLIRTVMGTSAHLFPRYKA